MRRYVAKVLALAVPLVPAIVYIVIRPGLVVFRDNEYVVDAPAVVWGTALGGTVLAVVLAFLMTARWKEVMLVAVLVLLAGIAIATNNGATFSAITR